MVNPRVDVPRDDTVVARPASQILPESGAKHILKESSSEKACFFFFFLPIVDARENLPPSL